MRKVALSLALSGVLASQAHAVGLGEIRTHSALNQPLSANIELVETSPGDINDIQVALAPREVFEQVGITRSNLLDQLEFIPTIENGVATIKVVSLQPIQEPFLNFVLEVTWANGKLLREYTVLLDPPVFSDTQFAATPAPVVSEPAFVPEPPVVDTAAPADVVAVLPPVVDTVPQVTETELPAGGMEPFVAVPEPVTIDPAAPVAESEAFMYDGLETYPVEDIASLPEPVVLSEADVAAELNAPLPEGGFDPFVAGGALPDPEVMDLDTVATMPTYDDYPIEEALTLDEGTVAVVGDEGTEQIFVAESELTPAEAEIESIFTDEPVRAAPAPSPYGGETYKVQRGDTLGKIARLVGQPDAINRTMIALLRDNPSAFINNNMNLVRAGYVLRIPDSATVEGISEREALAMIASQNAAWKEYRTSVASVATPQLETGGFAGIADLENRIPAELGVGSIDRGEPADVTTTAEAGVDDLVKPSELKILVPEGAGDSVEGSDTTGTGAIGNLENEFALAKEQLETQTQQNAELRSRVAELESLLESKNRLIELKNEQLSDLQGQFSGEGETVADAAKSAATEATELASSAASAVKDTAKGLLPKTDAEQAAPTAEDKAVTEGSKTAVKEPEPVRKPAVQEEPGMLDTLKDNPNLLMGAGFGGLLLAALGWLLLRRKEEPEVQQQEEVVTTLAPEPELKSDEDVAEAVADVSDEVIEAKETELLDLDELDTEEPAIEEIVSSDSDLPVESGMSEATDDDEDEVMSEANVYLAYGLQDQAIDLLKPVVADNPERTDYALKLAEAYHAAGDRQGFAEVAESLKDKIDGENSPEWQKLSEWSEDLTPDSPLFGSLGKAATGVAAAGAAVAGAVGSTMSDAGEKIEDVLVDDSDADELDDLDDLISEESLSDSGVGGAVDDVEEIDLSELDDFDSSLIADEAFESVTTEEEIVAENLVSDDGIDLDDIVLEDQDEVLATSEIEDASVGLGPASTLAMEVDEDLDLDTLVGDDDSLNVFSTGEDEVSTKLDLAKAYLDMGDDEGAREALDEVINIGTETQRNEAMKLKSQLDA